MGKKLLNLKDIVWALCIVIGLAALFVGFVIAATRQYGGDVIDGRMELGAAAESSPAAAEVVSHGDGELHELPETKDLGQDYIDGLTFLCDSALIGLREYGVLSDGIDTQQVWGSSAGNIPFSSLSTCPIKYPPDGSTITAADAAMIRKPSTLIISVGTDGLATADKDSFITAYETLINDIRSASPNTKVVCLTLTSVTPSYAGSDGLSSYLIGEANDWLKDVCIATGAYYADAAHEVCSSGYLMSEYAASNGKGLNNAGLNRILEYLRVHAV